MTPRQQRRSPIVGILKAGQTRAVEIQPPMLPHERPLVLGPTADFVFEVETPDQIVLRNHSGHLVAFVVTIVPEVIARATMLPWGRLLGELQQPGGPERVIRGIWERLHQNLLNRPKE